MGNFVIYFVSGQANKNVLANSQILYDMLSCIQRHLSKMLIPVWSCCGSEKSRYSSPRTHLATFPLNCQPVHKVCPANVSIYRAFKLAPVSRVKQPFIYSFLSVVTESSPTILFRHSQNHPWEPQITSCYQLWICLIEYQFLLNWGSNGWLENWFLVSVPQHKLRDDSPWNRHNSFKSFLLLAQKPSVSPYMRTWVG